MMLDLYTGGNNNYGMSLEALAKFYTNNADYLENNGFFPSAIRGLAWLLVKFFTWLASGAKTVFDKAFGAVDFTNYASVNEFITNFKPLFIALMAISIFALGIILILNHEKKPKIVINICIAVLCVTCSTQVFASLNTAVKDIKKGVESIEVDNSGFDGPYDVVEQNLVDWVYLDDVYGMQNINLSNTKSKAAKDHRDITKENFRYINYSEVMNYKTEYGWNKNGNAETLLKYRLIDRGANDSEGQYSVTENYNGIGYNSEDDDDLLNEFYYRYKANTFNIIIIQIAFIIVYLAMAYKCVRIAYELVVARLLAYLYSAELSGGQKVAKILCFIRDSYIMLLLTVICVRIFYLSYAWVMEYTNNSLVQIFFILFLAFTVIDGPNLVEKLLGMDLGLKSSTARMMAAYGTMKASFKTAAGAAVGAGRGLKEAVSSYKKGSSSDNRHKNSLTNKQKQDNAEEKMKRQENKADNKVKNQDEQKNKAEDSNNSTANESFKQDKDFSFMNDDKSYKNSDFMNDKNDKDNNFNDKGNNFKADEKANGFKDTSFMENKKKNVSTFNQKNHTEMKSKFTKPKTTDNKPKKPIRPTKK